MLKIRRLFPTMLTICISLWMIAEAAAQTIRLIPDYQSSRVVIKGTSTVHDWQCVGMAIEGEIIVESAFLSDSALRSVGELNGIDTTPVVHARFPVRTLHGKNKAMDDKMYQALRASANPEIVYRLTSARLSDPPGLSSDTFILQTTGVVTVAGVSKDLKMAVRVRRAEGSRVTVSGEAPLSMTNFSIATPTAMFGAIRSGDAIWVEFEWALIPQAPVGKSDD